MKKNFMTTVKVQKPNRNRFDLSHDVKMSLKMGYLYPCLAMEALPGDKFRLGCDGVLRFAPLVAPAMQRFDMYVHYWFVPNRIIWENWEKFIAQEQVGGMDVAAPFWTIDPATPATYTALMDYLGIPGPAMTGGTEPERVSALAMAAYQCCWSEWYRNQALQDEIDYQLDDGENFGASLPVLRRRAWEHDYFTSALPYAQKGDPVQLPLGTFEDVPVVFDADTGTSVEWDAAYVPGGTPFPANAPIEDLDLNLGAPYAKTSELQAQAANINEIRLAMRLQEWLEINARVGTRYTELVQGHFGVRPLDARLQRPEYITGVKTPVTISEVLNTSGPINDTDPLPQGNMAGHGIAVTQGKYGSYFCSEHGWIIGLLSVRPNTAYMQGIPRQFLKFDPLEYYWPKFAHLGEDVVYNREIYAYTNTGGGTFGYLPRYADYRTMPSRVAGEFRNTLSYWHDARLFETQPQLNAEFIECNPDDRIFAVDEGEADQLYCHMYHHISADRMIPFYGTPML